MDFQLCLCAPRASVCILMDDMEMKENKRNESEREKMKVERILCGVFGAPSTSNTQP